MPEPSCKLYGIFARKAPVCVLFRRGPSKLVQVIKWNTDSDTFEFGQWLKGRIYERMGDLSPDGKLMVYFAANHKGNEGTWTAVSRPPYLTALALWFELGPWGGGGLFDSDRMLTIHAMGLPRLSGNAPKLRVRCRDFGVTGAQIERERMKRDGWVWLRELKVKHELGHGLITRASGIRRKDFRTATLRCEENTRRYTLIPRYSLRLDNDFVSLEGADWADFDHKGRPVYTSKGSLFAVDTSGAHLIADFSDRRFEPVAPPLWATQW